MPLNDVPLNDDSGTAIVAKPTDYLITLFTEASDDNFLHNFFLPHGTQMEGP